MADLVQIDVGDTTYLTASFVDADENAIPTTGDGSVPVTWSSTTAAVRVLPSTDPATAQLLAISRGRSLVTATCGEATCSVDIVVTEKGVPVDGEITVSDSPPAAASAPTDQPAAAPASTAPASTGTPSS